MTENLPANQPPSRHILGLDWEHNPHAPRFHRFGVSDGCHGVGGRMNPLTAYVALLRWRRVPARPE